ncbi:MAG: hypothetical protein K8R60_16835 [Burkholderiales bacterium]|nr:hypothetical protein [Burkholderiales bacterium]
MLRLTWEQFDRLEQLTLKRHAASISSVLAETWPALTERLQDRWPAFVEAAVQQGRKHGLRDACDLARYACLWCIWGPAFDGKPSFAWAAEILGDSRRSAALKLHQLAHRTRLELEQRHAAQGATAAAAGAAAALTTAQFETALTAVDARMSVLAAARSVFPSSQATVVAVKPCDLGSIDMMVAEAENLQEYRHTPNGWQRFAVAKVGEGAVKWTRAPDEPVELAVASHALRRGAPARLNLRIETHAVCDPRVHPEVVHVGAEGQLAWKGRDTARLSLALYAPTPPPLAASAARPGIAAEAPFDRQTVRVASCGLRDAGAPFGDVAMEVRVYDAAQWLTEVRHPAWEPMVWPGSAEGEAAPSATCKLEKDGAADDASAWQRSWRDLHAAFRGGMEKLYNEWARVLDNPASRLEVEASPLVGQAGVTWGWRRTSAASVTMRTEGALDLLALSLELRLSGELVDGPARSRIRVHCKGRSELRMTLAQLGDKGQEGQDLKSVLRTWRFPFTLEIEPLAGAEPLTLSAAAGPMAIGGALVGECGLRPRGDAVGLQWFFALRAEPVAIITETSDPVLGGTRKARKIFPALSLVDWSAG